MSRHLGRDHRAGRTGRPGHEDDVEPGQQWADVPVYVISRAAELAGMHPQTLRQYDRLGLVSPRRTKGRGRRYSMRDIETLREVQRLSQVEGVNLAGIQRILQLEAEIARLRGHIDLLSTAEPGTRIFSAGVEGDVVVVRRRPRRRGATRQIRSSSGALVVWRPPRAQQ